MKDVEFLEKTIKEASIKKLQARIIRNSKIKFRVYIK
jgi:hypothetical protein|tara:strand:- start:281 stop:391 length:111 start_codon:yes stop_codon:yes gene_type:complete